MDEKPRSYGCMFGIDWVILILVTVIFNIIWPPIMILVGIYSAEKTLKTAKSIEARVEKAIREEREQIKMEDTIAAIMGEFSERQKSMLDGKMADIYKKMEEKIDGIEKKMVDKGGGPSITDLALTGLSMFKPD